MQFAAVLLRIAIRNLRRRDPRTVLIAAMPFEIERLAEAEIRRRFDCTLSG
jgi:hypothetical protein